MEKGETMLALKELMSRVEPLPDEPHFTTLDETIVRYLKSSDWKLKEAEKALLSTIEYRRQNRPLRGDCTWCHDRPGYHSMRQVGHDECGRPVIYSNFAQASTHKNTVEDVVSHVTYLIENAKATMEVGVTTWVFVIDCTGMSMSACNPKLGYGMSNILSNHYPERLGLVICVNHNPMFHGVWKALKKVVSPGTSSKVRLVRSPSKMQQVFSTFFSEELTSWLMEEIELNKQKPLPQSQQEFWAAPTTSPKAGVPAHDPRGSPAYVRDYILPFYYRKKDASGSGTPSRFSFFRGAGSSKAASSSTPNDADSGPVVPRHKPHPNIVDALFNSVHVIAQSSQEQASCSEATSSGDDLNIGNDIVDLNIDNQVVCENGHSVGTNGEVDNVTNGDKNKDDDDDKLFEDFSDDDELNSKQKTSS